MESEDTTGSVGPHSSEAPSRIGPYKILDVLGEGGMGIVYLAEQEIPIRRRVAIKIIKGGLDTKRVVARFEAERQALALMKHPNVARVFDAGTTKDRRPYFAMEYVEGVPITEHCDRERLTTKERLELFVQTCDGVQHAHQMGIIHRDIKPRNVLVAREGEKATPKIIDFGVAKATAHRLTDKTVFTELGTLIGTPEYMSPEQADLTNDDIDTRTDVYSLGVLLYELLIGVLPFESRQLRSAGFDELRRIIREEDPSKPSMRLTTLGAQSGDLARNRRTGVRDLAGQIRGDLDWIAMKALSKSRDDRYRAVSALGEDVARHLKGLPVLAGPPTLRYRGRKFVLRHRRAVGLGLALTLALGGAAVSAAAWYRSRVRLERDRLAAEETRAMLALRDPYSAVRAPLDGAIGRVEDEGLASRALGRAVTRILAGEATREQQFLLALSALDVEPRGRRIQDINDPTVALHVSARRIPGPSWGLGVRVTPRVGWDMALSSAMKTVAVGLSSQRRGSYDLEVTAPVIPGDHTLTGWLDACFVRMPEDLTLTVTSDAAPDRFACLTDTIRLALPAAQFTFVAHYPASYPTAIADATLADQFLAKLEFDPMVIRPKGDGFVGVLAFSLPEAPLDTLLEVSVTSTAPPWRLAFALLSTGPGGVRGIHGLASVPGDEQDGSVSLRNDRVEAEVSLPSNVAASLTSRTDSGEVVIEIRSVRDLVIARTSLEQYLEVDSRKTVPVVHARSATLK